jgi:pSer/pThr/pTyr-binding forkhead associated (FHA) protein
MQDPVVGWLAIVKGPGAGDFVRMGYGFNSIGRGPDQRCQLDFGDEKISRQNHASITYDPRGRKFYLQHGGGQNLTYIGDVPVLQPTELKGGEFIVIGATVLRFVPLCGQDFDYPDAPEQPV